MAAFRPFYRQRPPFIYNTQFRLLSTEPRTTPVTGSDFPPPGFSAEQAKKPLAQERNISATEKSKASSTSTTKQDVSRSGDLSAGEKKVATDLKAKSEEAGSLTDLAAVKLAGEKTEESKVLEKAKNGPKPTIMQRIKKEVTHYWDGTKLLAAEIKISTKLALKMAAGYELTRRENRQVRL